MCVWGRWEFVRNFDVYQELRELEKSCTISRFCLSNDLLCDLGGNGGASSSPESGQEFLKGVEPSVGVVIECLSNFGDGGLVSDRSRECVGFGGSGISQISVSLRFVHRIAK